MLSAARKPTHSAIFLFAVVRDTFSGHSVCKYIIIYRLMLRKHIVIGQGLHHEFDMGGGGRDRYIGGTALP